jgi:aspartate 1-decarboxylase|tara:strand:+ start:124 stop:510 length:387 start_codon:yes stop_codon:yes gene_type:complete
MKMKKTLLRSKLHRINVTQVELDYEGSCAVDTEILSKGNMQEYEKIDIYNVTNGERFSTYLMAAEAGSKTVSINGAAAHKASPNDIIIICSYGLFNEQEALSHEPVLVYFDSDNNIKSIKNAIPEQKL